MSRLISLPPTSHQIPDQGRLIVTFKALQPVLVHDQALGPEHFQLMWGDQVCSREGSGGEWGGGAVGESLTRPRKSLEIPEI